VISAGCAMMVVCSLASPRRRQISGVARPAFDPHGAVRHSLTRTAQATFELKVESGGESSAGHRTVDFPFIPSQSYSTARKAADFPTVASGDQKASSKHQSWLGRSKERKFTFGPSQRILRIPDFLQLFGTFGLLTRFCHRSLEP
jgi:hypothetical protein